MAARTAPTYGLVGSLIWINEPTKVFIARRGVHELTTTILSADAVRDLVEKMLKSSGRRVDLSTRSSREGGDLPAGLVQRGTMASANVLPSEGLDG